MTSSRVSTVRPGLHELGDRRAVPGALEDVVGDERGRLGLVELEPAGLPTPGQLGGVGEQQPFLLVGGQVHGVGPPGVPGWAEPGS